MSKTRIVLRGLVPAAACAVTVALAPSPASATIHPIIQSVNCAAAAAFANAPIADPPGQTPEEFVSDTVTPGTTTVTISFPAPLEFSQSDFRAVIATGFVDEIVTDANGDVTSLIVNLADVPMAVSGQGGEHCA